jgi:hypothetical protein
MLLLAPAARAGTLLMMFETQLCEWCERWDAEVGVIYHKTDEGRAAPLVRHDISAPLPEGITLARRARYTPTFVLLRDGVEFGRIEGYPGEAFFYGLLQDLLKAARNDS